MGAFGLSFGLETGRPSILLRLICWAANMRSRWLKMPYGDQALFMRWVSKADLLQVVGNQLPESDAGHERVG